ncbi:LysM peptidoglycan-binding domain-containing protein [Cupriavidus pauculus]|nr:LysM peptidoglycan-binding domain-containing protein [Cupriavidus pauculus]
MIRTVERVRRRPVFGGAQNRTVARYRPRAGAQRRSVFGLRDYIARRIEAVRRQVAQRIDRRDLVAAQVEVVRGGCPRIGKTYDAAGNVTAELHADGGVVSYRYNAFGNKLGMLDAMGWLTRYTYDAANRLTSTIHAGTDVTYIDDNYNLQSAGWQNVTERYYYDQAGRLTMQIDGAGAATRYAYDMRGNLLSTTQPMGQLTRSAYDALNHKIAEVDPNNMASTWSYNYFGKVTHHTDIGGAVYSYAYDNAQQLIAQSNTRGQSLNYYYDAAGQVTQVNDNALGQVTTYAYDLAGNRVREKTTQGGVVYQDNFLAYDALNRLRDVADGQVHISFQYDAVGNRTYIEQHSVDGNNRSDAGRYFRYDAMNRQTIVDGVDPYGNLGAQGHAITYDLNGNRTSDRYYGNKVVTAGGESVIIGYQESGEAIYGTTPTSFVRTQGVVEELYRYDNLGRLTSVVRDGVQIDHRYYDGAGRVMVSGASNLPVDYVTKLNEGVPQDQTNGMELRINQYDANGRLLHQRTLKSNGALKSDVNYDTYDAAGNVLNYSLTDYDGGYTNWYAYSMQRFEGYKQGTVSGTSNKMNPGSTTSNYDVNGNLVSVTDSTKPANNRTFVNDLAGHVLQVNQGGNINRQLVVNGEVLGQHGVGINPVTPKDGQGNPNFSYNADYDFGYQPIVANYPNAAPGSYTVQTGDSLQSIARSAYGDSALWYRIAEANGLSSDRDLRVGQTLNIPNKATGIHNDSGVFKPYDSSKVVGDTTPNLPMPSAGGGGGCGMLGSIIVAAVTIVVAVISQQYYLANGVVAGGGAGAGTAAAAGATTAAGATAAGTTAVTYTAGSMAMAGAVGGVAGAVAGQVVGMALGIQNGFDWKAVALGAIGGGVAGGLSGVNVVSSAIGNAAIRGALTSAVTQGIGVATGLQKSFNWKGVVGSAVGAAVGAGVNEALGDRLGVDTAGRFAKGAVTAFSAGVSTAAARGGRIDVTTIAADAFGNALGSSLAQQNSSQPNWQERLLNEQADPVTGVSRGNVSFAGQALHESRVSDLRDMAANELAVGGPTSTGTFAASAPAYFAPEPTSSPTPSYESLVSMPQVTASGTDGQGRDWYQFNNGTMSQSVLSPAIVGTPLSEVQMVATGGAGSIQPDPGWATSLGNILGSDLPISQKVGMAWDQAKYYFRGSDAARGTVQVVGGVAEVAGALGLSSTGAGAVIGVPLAFHGGDNIGTGLTRIFDGGDGTTFTYKTTYDVSGSRLLAQGIDQGIPFLGGVASLGQGLRLAESSVLSNTSYRALTATDAQALANGLGLTAKAPSGNWTAVEHVLNAGPGRGGAQLNSPWISTTRDLNVAVEGYSSGNGLVAVNLSRVPAGDQVEVWKGLARSSTYGESMAYHRAIWAQEVSVYRSIPVQAIYSPLAPLSQTAVSPIVTRSMFTGGVGTFRSGEKN